MARRITPASRTVFVLYPVIMQQGYFLVQSNIVSRAAHDAAAADAPDGSDEVVPENFSGCQAPEIERNGMAHSIQEHLFTAGALSRLRGDPGPTNVNSNQIGW